MGMMSITVPVGSMEKEVLLEIQMMQMARIYNMERL